jgi:DNA-binding response OmpR family regulator
MKIALIEDEIYLNDAIKMLLEYEDDFYVDSFKNLKDFLKNMNKHYDLIIADITLPDGNFLQELAKYKLAEKTKTIIISSHSEIENIKKAFNLGAEDFIKKPFEYEELLLRIKRLFKTKRTQIAKNIYYEPESKMLITPKEKNFLTKKEAKLLELLLENKNKFVSLESISNHVWDEKTSSNTIAALVKRLRAKLNNKSLIISKREIGYMLKG